MVPRRRDPIPRSRRLTNAHTEVGIEIAGQGLELHLGIEAGWQRQRDVPTHARKVQVIPMRDPNHLERLPSVHPCAPLEILLGPRTCRRNHQDSDPTQDARTRSHHARPPSEQEFQAATGVPPARVVTGFDAAGEGSVGAPPALAGRQVAKPLVRLRPVRHPCRLMRNDTVFESLPVSCVKPDFLHRARLPAASPVFCVTPRFEDRPPAPITEKR